MPSHTQAAARGDDQSLQNTNSIGKKAHIHMPHYDYNKDYPFAAFITNLGKYNEGTLVGEWVKFSTTT